MADSLFKNLESKSAGDEVRGSKGSEFRRDHPIVPLLTGNLDSVGGASAGTYESRSHQDLVKTLQEQVGQKARVIAWGPAIFRHAGTVYTW